MVTAAAVAHANRLPVLLLVGDTFASRLPDPVLQQVEHFDVAVDYRQRCLPRSHRATGIASCGQSRSCNRCRRRSRPARPGRLRPGFLGLSQDAQGEAFDYPAFSSHRPCIASAARGRTRTICAPLPRCSQQAKRPLIIAGGGVLYSLAESALGAFAERPASRSSKRLPVAACWCISIR